MTSTLEDVGPASAPDGPPIRLLVAEHLGIDPGGAALLVEEVPVWQKVNLQRALDAFVAAPGRTHTRTGVALTPPTGNVIMTSAAPISAVLTDRGARPSGIELERVDCGPGASTAVVKRGLHLIHHENGPVAIWVRDSWRAVAVDVLALDITHASAVLAELRDLMRAHDAYRGHHLTLRSNDDEVKVEFAARPSVARDELILPPGVLEAIEEHAIGIGRMADELTAAGRHLKRGLLLYGPPGTGKTHTIRYLASQLPEATLFVMAGSGMAWLDIIKKLVVDLTPAIVVLDDVDLIAEDRDLSGLAPRQMLFSLLDAMDGMREDADILFVLTTNRVETVERAVAARPGRIDHAVEIGLPDADSRRRLLDLYGRGLDLRLEDTEAVVTRTEGVTASFVKELLRRSFLVADDETDSDDPPVVTDRHLHASLDVLLDPDNPLTPALLGVPRDAIERAAATRGVGQAWCGI